MDKATRADVIAGCLIIAVVAFFFWVTTGLPEQSREPADIGPRFFPVAVLTVILVLSCLLIAKAFWRAGTASPDRQPDNPGATDPPADAESIDAPSAQVDRHYGPYVLAIALLTLYVLLLSRLGLIVSTLIFVAAALLLFTKDLKKSLLYGILYTVALYLVFAQILNVRFDTGVLESFVRSLL